jgi:hypothetical protein
MKWLTRPETEQVAPELADYGCPTVSEIQDITKHTTPELVRRFNIAITTLLMMKERLDDRTPWRELVKTLALYPTRLETIDIINSKGEPVTIQAYINRGNGPHGLHPAIQTATLELSDLLEEIDRIRERNKANGSKGGRPLGEGTTSEEIAAWLKRRGYSQSTNKKELVIEAMDFFDVKKTKVTDAIREHGLARPKASKGGSHDQLDN